jgi:hypothetical protein
MHDCYSQMNSRNWLGPLVMKNGSHISAIEKPGG